MTDIAEGADTAKATAPDPGPAPTLAEATATLTAPGQMFEIEELTIRGVPTRTWKSAPATLRSVLELSALHGDKDFLIYEDERVSFAEHFRIAASLGHSLAERFGIAKGDRVAIAMRNLPEWVMAFWASISVGAVVVPINAWWTGPELTYGLFDSGSSVVFVDEEREARIRPHLAELPNLRAVIVTSEEHLETGGRRAPVGSVVEREGLDPMPVVPFAEAVGTPVDGVTLPPADIDPDDDATIFYTSGTTGRPKGAVGTHRNSASNLMNLFFVATVGSARRSGGVDTEAGTQNANLLSVPLFHATGCHATLVTNTAAGGKLVMMHHFNPERALELIERERVTIFGGVPTMVMQVIDSPDFAKRDVTSVKSISYGGAPCPPDLVRRITEHFPAGSPGNGYGLTETSAMTTMNNGNDYIRKPTSVGPPSPVCDVAVVPEDYEGSEPPVGQSVDPERTGELWIKGPNVVRGYWNRPEETQAAFSQGWLHTGDVARIDEEGFVHIVDRAKDMIIRGGENVYCVEVEAALFEHPSVADCAVIGVPHPVLGEEVGAVVVLRPGEDVGADELGRFVKERLAGFSVPTRFWFRAEPLPRNPAGKALKRELRTELLGPSPAG
ncbi:MAG TPA: class I adenylate-forming enzyme family protein [Acidimicrobiales bacterium]|jgi:long-chain acyl-CoA synthetase|nr:class I adenylate-forming enzyme family protein [Acidimicrobiales bacterium]